MVRTITTFFQTLMEFIMFWKKKRAGDIIVKTAEIYDAMRAVVLHEKLGVQRFLVIKAHNGGGNFRNDAMTYATVLHEEIRKPMVSVKQDYQSLPIDGHYNDMLKKIYVDGELDLNYERMNKDSLLGNIYSKEGIKHARLFFLKHNKKGFWFCSVATADAKNQLDTSDHEIAITIAVAKIKARI